LIAVTTSEIRPGHPATPEGEPSQPEMVLGLKYLTAIERSGGIPVVVPPLDHDAIEPLLDRASGVCLSGGPDLHPAAYAERGHLLLGPTWPELDEFELALARAADRRNLPILAICRGLQVLNVARGGSLHQHLPDVVGRRISHRQEEPAHHPTHWVTLGAHGRLRRILECGRTRVNSFHHQAVAELGSGLVVTSQSADGTIESLEAEDRDFVVAVQWHAEALVDRPRQAGLFTAFVEAARRSESGRYLERAA
jgi:putative glutamine amidotransferase